MKFAAYTAVSFITFFQVLLVLFCIIVYMAVCFVCFKFSFVQIAVMFYVVYVPFCIFCFIVSFCVLFVCKCVLYYCHRVSTQLRLPNLSYHIIYHIIFGASIFRFKQSIGTGLMQILSLALIKYYIF